MKAALQQPRDYAYVDAEGYLWRVNEHGYWVASCPCSVCGRPLATFTSACFACGKPAQIEGRKS